MKKALKHSTKILIEIMSGLFILFLIGLGFFAWKLSQGPIDLNIAIPYVQEQFADNTSGQKIEIESLVLNWHGFENPLGLKAKNIVLLNENGPYLFSPDIDLDISYRWLVFGKLKFQTIWVRNTTISITKTKDGKIQITGQTPKEDNDKPSLQPATLTVNNLVNDIPSFETLWIDKARIIYRDEMVDRIQTFDPATFFIEMKKQGGDRNLYGFLTFPFGNDTINNSVKINFSTQNDPVLLSISGNLSQTPMDNFIQFMPVMPDGFDLNTIVSANIRAQFDNNWGLHELNLDLDAPRGQFHFPLNETMDFVDFHDLKMRIINNPKSDMTEIENMSVRINEDTLVELTGALNHPQSYEDVSGNINLSVQNLPQSYFQKFWPKAYADNGAYRWLAEKINGGTFSTVNITSVFDLSATERTDGSPLPPQLISVKGNMAYTDLNIQYHPEMARAENVSGTGTYDDIGLNLDITRANIGGMVTEGATLYFDDLITEGSGLGQLKFPVQSQAQKVFDFIAAEPINAFDKTDFKPRNTKGDVEATIDIEIPLLKDVPIEDILVTVNGTVNNADIPNAVKGLTLSGGPYEIYSTTEEIKVNGSGQLAGKPITLEWHEYFSAKPERDYVSKVVANVTANDRIRRAFTNDFADYFKGDSTGDITYIKSSNNRDATIDLTLDTTATNIDVPSLGVDKKSGQTSSATAKVRLRNGDLVAVENLNIKGRGLSVASGNLSFRNVGGEPLITKAKLNKVAFNENRINVEMAEQNNILKTNVTGGFLDIQPILTRSKSEGDGQDNTGRAREYGVSVDEMRTAEEYTIKNAEAYIRLDKTGQADQFEMDAKLGSEGQLGELYIRYTPEVEDGLTLRVESNNAGETLRAFDLYPYINGGQLQIAGVPTAGGRFGDVRGKARINNFSVANAPVLLRLVNALSFQNFLQAGGLSFSRLESDFEWTLGEGGDVYKISNGTTSGASVALTFDGYVDTATNNMDVTGTAAPLSELNNFVGKIPLIGQILTGGDALLAATYSIKGNLSDPSVGVNPLSILTPGIIRKMLFENTPDAEKQKDRQTNNPSFENNERTRGMN